MFTKSKTSKSLLRHGNPLRWKKSSAVAGLLLFPMLTAIAQTYMWYPGQLAAYRQAKQKEMSEARCVNVGYPGNFNPICKVAYFKSKADGKVIKVEYKGSMPTLWGNPEEWQVSLDGSHWNIPESDSRNTDRNILPDADKEIVVPVKPKSIKVVKNATVSDGTIKMNWGGTVIVDFHELELGNVTLTVNGAGRIGFWAGESEEEAMNEDMLIGEQTALPSYTLDGKTKTITLPDYAVRFLKIRTSKSATITGITFNTKMWPVEHQLQFECSNQRINAMYNTGVKTLHTSLHNFYLDGVKRDFLPWAMDAMVSSLGANYTFGDRQMTRNCISIALMPPNPTEKDLGVVDYPLHAIIGLEDDYQRFGDLSTSLMYRERIEQQLSFYEQMMNRDGFIEAKRPAWGFIPGWNVQNGPDKYGTACYPQILLYLNFKIGAQFAKRWGDNQKAKHYETLAKNLSDKIKKAFWDNGRKAFANGYKSNGEKDTRISHQAQIIGVIAGLYPAKHYNYLFDKLLPTLPHYYSDVSYEKGYDALAFTKAGKTAQLYTLLDKVWGKWIDDGGVRYPENFYIGSSRSKQLTFYNRPYGMSLCHGANGVPPVIFVLRGIFGFQVKGNGSYTLSPNLINMNWAKGRIPVKEGYIEVELQKGKAPVVRAPKGCSVKVLKQHGT